MKRPKRKTRKEKIEEAKKKKKKWPPNDKMLDADEQDKAFIVTK